MLPTIALTATALLASRRAWWGILLAALVTFGSAELAARLFRLVPSYVLVGTIVVLLVCTVVVLRVPYWNPVGQLMLGSYVAAAGSYLALAPPEPTSAPTAPSSAGPAPSGARAHARVLDRFLTPRQLAETMALVCEFD